MASGGARIAPAVDARQHGCHPCFTSSAADGNQLQVPRSAFGTGPTTACCSHQMDMTQASFRRGAQPP